MKRLTMLVNLLLLALVVFPFRAIAQTTDTTLESLHIAFWPDFDDPSVLVLMDGRLPGNITTPTQVTIPLPQGARVNAVARSGEAFNLVDLPYELNDQGVSFTISPEETFRVEFYMPYNDDGQWRRFNYEWLTNMDVAEVTAEVQQPQSARELVTEPAAIQTRVGTSDGLTYYTLPARAVPAGSSYAVSFRYNQIGQGSFIENNWILLIAVFGLVLVASVVTWIVTTRVSARRGRRRSKRPPKPKKSRAPVAGTKTAVKYCHNCGHPAEASDLFCRNCGTQLKN